MASEKCDRLAKAGVAPATSAYKSKKLTLEQSNRIKEICVNCPLERCVYELRKKRKEV